MKMQIQILIFSKIRNYFRIEIKKIYKEGF